MSSYTHILAGLDLSEESSQVLSKAHAIAHAFEAKLSLAHIIEPLTFTYGGDIPMDMTAVQDQIQQQATEELNRVANLHDIPLEQQFIAIGQPANELQHLAKENNADLIVVGSHGRHGLSLILGSTCNSVLHGCGCDVLAVRVK
ncbi:universal stress protein [Marinibactrum halimedae]|uniref:Universal stress protein n=1 Tax=Marinibactrum halimedae TaxID=1444977 RepID=A0AA37WMI6_9GAMM|nr:universal stress protein [Marinibactrum halimedae]MCD9459203.1 universal stress protein [Marinibactrum halimedae]GLS27274.1 universal stress protein [Marinibactrum halimedae]